MASRGGGSEGVDEKILSLKSVFYLEDSNATSFSSIGHHGSKLFNFLTFLDIFWAFWGVKMLPPRGGLRQWVKKVFH